MLRLPACDTAPMSCPSSSCWQPLLSVYWAMLQRFTLVITHIVLEAPVVVFFDLIRQFPEICLFLYVAKNVLGHYVNLKPR